MPIECSIPVSRISTEEFRAMDYEIMAIAYACHNEIGRLADEAVYHADFAARLKVAGFDVHREVPIRVSFLGFVKVYYLDVVVAGKAVYELKTVSRLTDNHAAQVMNYLLLLDCGHGKWINFRSSSVESVFVNAPMTSEQRKGVSIRSDRWMGADSLAVLIVDLIRDLGSALELPLYYQALIYLLGGETVVTKLLPMIRGG